MVTSRGQYACQPLSLHRGRGKGGGSWGRTTTGFVQKEGTKNWGYQRGDEAKKKAFHGGCCCSPPFLEQDRVKKNRSSIQRDKQHGEKQNTKQRNKKSRLARFDFELVLALMHFFEICPRA